MRNYREIKHTSFLLLVLVAGIIAQSSALPQKVNTYLKDRNFRAAYESLKTGIDSLRELNEFSENRVEYLLMGSYCSSQLGIWDTSYLLARESLPISDSLEMHSAAGTARMNMGISLKSWGQFDEAVRIYKSAMKDLEEAEDTLNLMNLYSNIGIVYKEWARYDEARRWYRKVLAYREQIKDTTGLIVVLNNLAGVHFASDDTTGARKMLERAVSHARATGHTFYEAFLLENGAVSIMEYEMYDEALEKFTMAQKLFRTTNNKEGVALSYGNLASVYSGKGEYEKALIYHDSTLSALRKLKQEPRIADALFSAGKTLFRAGLYARAADTLRRTVSILEKLRLTAEGEVRRDYFSSEIGAYQWLVSSLVRAKDTISAAEMTEQASARYLAETLSGTEKVKTEQLKRLRGRIPRRTLHLTFANVCTEAPFTVFAYDRKNIRALEPDVDSMISVLEPVMPQMVSFKPTDALRGIRIVGTKQARTVDFEGVVTAYRNLLLQPHLTGSQAVAFRKISAALYGFLLSGFEDMLKGKDEVVIVPDGFLATLPFETLLTSRGQYLVETHTIRYLPSATISGIIAARKPNSLRSTLCAFGGAVYNDSALSSASQLSESQISAVRADVMDKIDKNQNLDDAFELIGLDAWTNLPGTLGEVNALKDIFKDAKVIIGKSVNEKTVIDASEKGLLSNYKYLHFAVHGFVVPEIPELSALVLSSAGTEIGGSDGYLMAHEVAKLNLDADVVTLSACETALGKIYPGEGVVGLAQSFLIAGSRGVTSSLWQVSDESTRKLMTETYSQMIKNRLSFAEALASVKRSFIKGEIVPESNGASSEEKTYKHPFFWAPFIYYGN